MSREFIHLKVKRQDDANSQSYWEEFKIPYKPNMNVVSVLMEVRKNPVNANGQKVSPVVWECNCLEEVCGACSMRVNGKPRQACSALIDKIDQSPIMLEPLSKFPVIRDLMIDRQIMFDNLRKVMAWVNVDGSWDLGRGPRFAEKTRVWAYHLSRCMTCGCCMEACPNVSSKSPFIGPAALNQVRLFNVHGLGSMDKEKRLDSIMGVGGITDCGNSQNCVQVCPKDIPLTTSIADLNKDTTIHGIKRFLNK
ncbi:succinate dehydrogenase iron-sulfur subunit [Metallumcola ferriviriculae]|uniref:succinate dehydrogenase n=1 Tax=Metallumcola ferriviriculae TaxID=3039180 RepID=A0AAU0UQH2_9FIRM|nr:succinate dehydrogenase iron-sulfur subunit [Desulfitibacteraceae bacterium MK1]